MSERLILTLDGSTRVCGAALLGLRASGAGAAPEGVAENSVNGGVGGGANPDSWEVVARRTNPDGRGQAKVLLRMLDDMLHEVGGGPEDLGAIVVGTGPGTFTGVRITVATGRALSLALKIPVLGVSTLAALAAGAAVRSGGGGGSGGASDPAAADGASSPGLPEIIVPVVDARRGQLFYGLYQARPAARGSAAGLTEGSAAEGGTAGGLTEGVAAGGRAAIEYLRSAPFSVCGRDELGAVLPGAGVGGEGREARVLIVAEDGDLIDGRPEAARLVVMPVEPEYLVVGQERLSEPGDRPEGRRLAPWLIETLRGGAPAGSDDRGPASLRAGEVGTPEAVTPIYVRSPDADIHITKMKDPWADAGGGRRNPKGR
jgi:tRNA threonylcarbamoyl adenosine modification protein YeaZ